MVYAAGRYGVGAVGITLSQAQLEEARAWARQRGLEGRVRVEALDYREVRDRFNKVASVGMAEHVGRANLGRYFQAAFARLEPGGLFLHRAIARGPVPPRSPAWAASGKFMRRYVFPDVEIVPLWEMLREAETAGFEVRDVEDLREHYAPHLRALAPPPSSAPNAPASTSPPPLTSSPSATSPSTRACWPNPAPRGGSTSLQPRADL